MSWPQAKEIQSWKDICEKILGIKFNNGKEITSYPITEREHLANASNQYTLANYDKNPCKNAPNKSLSFRTCSFGELVVIIYHILIKEFADKLFNEENLRAFFDRVNSAVGAWRENHPEGGPGSKALAMVISILKIRLTRGFSSPAAPPPKQMKAASRAKEKSSEDDDTDDPQEDLPQIALGLIDSMGNDLARVLVKSYNTNSTFGSVLNSMKKDVLDTVRTMPAPLTAPYINLGVKGWLDVSLELKWCTDEEWLEEHGGYGQGRAESNAKKQEKAKTLFETKLEDYVKLNFRTVKPASNVSAYLNSTHRWDLRFTYVDKQPVPLIPIVVSIDWDKLSEECGREDTNS